MGITQISGNIFNNKYPLNWVIKQLFHTFLCNSQNYHYHLVGDSFDCCTERYEIVVYYHPLGAVDDPMHCCPRPKATVHRVIHSTDGRGQQCIGSSTAPRGDSFDCCTERYEIVVYCKTVLKRLK